MEFDILNHDADLVADINELLDQHLEDEEPAVTINTFRRLVNEGYTDYQARNLIGKCVAFELTSEHGFDQRRYALHLSYLPQVNFEW
ncbi:MAG: hypothetical protein ACOCPM_03965 [Bacteroidales bacterium]